MADTASIGTIAPAELRWLFPSYARSRDRGALPVQRVKRVLDLVVCLALLPFAAVMLLACAIAIRLESPGPVLERASCTGRGGRSFRRYRLRTVRDDGPLRALEVVREPEVTRVGRVLRVTGLAALPQLFNVLRGEMSLVGPRPTAHPPGSGRLWYTARYEVKPGIVSAAQVSARAGATFEDRLRLDIAYVRDGTIALDLQILLRAAGIVARRWRDLVVPDDDVVAAVAARARAQVQRPLAAYWRARGILLATSDAVAIVAAVGIAYWVRFGMGLRLPGAHTSPPADLAHAVLYAKSAAILAAVWLFGLRREGEYHSGLRGSSAPTVRLTAIGSSGAYALGMLMVVGFMYRDLLLSRQVFVVGAALALVMIVGVRTLFGAIDRRIAGRGLLASRVLIAGTGGSACAFAATLRREAPWMDVVGYLSDGEAVDCADIRVLGSVRDVAQVHARVKFDTIVLASPRLAVEAMQEPSEPATSLVNFCEQHDIALYMLSGSYSVAVSPEEITSFFGMPLIRLKDASLDPMYALVKRVVDVAVALAIILLGLPAWLALAAAVKLTSPGPLFFTQLRTGQGGRPFRMYKFRSMAADAEKQLEQLVDLTRLDEPVFKLRNDPRVTPIGAWMRRTGMDEIPQLLNVLKGEMSLVGPRPEEARLVDRYTAWQRRRLKARPGITGYQQIKNRGGTSLAERVEHDLVYLKHQSMTLDLYILCRTPIVLIRGSGITH